MVVACQPTTRIYRSLGLFWQSNRGAVTQKRLYKCYTVGHTKKHLAVVLSGNMIFVYV